jgi:hypothetical protein
MTDNSKVTGFNTLSTLRFENFTERNLSEIERILLSLRESDDFQTIKNFYINLKTHLNDTAPHPFDITPYKGNIINQLYEIYRRYGGTATKEEMLLQIEKEIPIASSSDIIAGINDSKAVTAKQFKPVFESHTNNLQAHERLHNALMPTTVFTGVPTLYLSTLFIPTSNDIDITDIWNTSAGTIVLRNNFRTPGSIFKLMNNRTTILEISIDSTNIVISINQAVTTMPLAEGLVKDVIVISYSNKSIIIADCVNVVTIPYNQLLHASSFILPNGISNDTTGNDLYELTYYPTAANADEIRFLLN